MLILYFASTLLPIVGYIILRCHNGWCWVGGYAGLCIAIWGELHIIEQLITQDDPYSDRFIIVPDFDFVPVLLFSSAFVFGCWWLLARAVVRLHPSVAVLLFFLAWVGWEAIKISEWALRLNPERTIFDLYIRGADNGLYIISQQIGWILVMLAIGATLIFVLIGFVNIWRARKNAI